MSEIGLRPFWRYYGGKSSAAKHYPAPRHATIVEPFAGSAGYAMCYPDLNVILVEKNPTVAGIWRWLIGASVAEIRSVPLVDALADLPTVHPSARDLVGFCLGDGRPKPTKKMSESFKAMRANGRPSIGWGEVMRERAATQVERIRHWQVIEGDYTLAPDVEATWFVDPPYDNAAGRCYPFRFTDYEALARWCRTRQGQVIACENEGATWLPFQPFRKTVSNASGKSSMEAVWVGGGEIRRST